MPTICLLFYARAMVNSFTVSYCLHFCLQTKEMSHHTVCDVTFAASVGILQVLSCIQYTNSLMITYVCCHLFTTYTIVMLVLCAINYCLLLVITIITAYLITSDDHVPRLISRWLATGPVFWQGNMAVSDTVCTYVHKLFIFLRSLY